MRMSPRGPSAVKANAAKTPPDTASTPPRSTWRERSARPSTERISAVWRIQNGVIRWERRTVWPVGLAPPGPPVPRAVIPAVWVLALRLGRGGTGSRIRRGCLRRHHGLLDGAGSGGDGGRRDGGGVEPLVI